MIKKGPKVVVPPRIDKKELFADIAKLNEKQLQLVMHLYKCFKIGNLNGKVLLLGPAGMGKSLVIKVLFQLITAYFDNFQGCAKDSAKVALSAYTGKAASNIGGVAVHGLFSLRIHKGNLSGDVANSLRCEFKDIKLVIIDEVSMIGYNIPLLPREFAASSKRI
jgi:hypothetical protein